MAPVWLLYCRHMTRSCNLVFGSGAGVGMVQPCSSKVLVLFQSMWCFRSGSRSVGCLNLDPLSSCVLGGSVSDG